MAASIAGGYMLHAAVERTRATSGLDQGTSAVSAVVRGWFNVDPILAAILAPAVIVAVLSLGAMCIWARTDR
ncbi:MAG TPA: hypothetical protein VGB88_00975 [Alphaproteobacteria bacterium]